ncbi:MAG: insulinase family protein [Gemmatimonadota bacterium]|nr:insulinase family protein [Gemmatimonadota bacterium]MDH5804180.1 insulinase family protein [Gemmatimonadota bacterium]
MIDGLKTEQLDKGLFRTEADNGVTVISEHIDRVRSVAVGMWVRTAAVHEHPSRMGVSHFLEHMVFKGTERRSARDIALELEVRGGSLDAFTSREHTAFQARVLDEDVGPALDVLTDLVRNPALRQKDLDLEKKVILEEIGMVEDTPDELVFDIHSETLWPDHPYGYSILGTRDTVASLTADDLRELHSRAYHPKQVVIAGAGNLPHDKLLEQLAKCGWFEFPAGPDRPEVPLVPRVTAQERRIHKKELAQTHIVMGTDTFPYADPRRYSLMLLTTVLGSGMSSRLFQRVREQLGLAYAVYAFQSFYEHVGVSGVYVGTRHDQAEQAVDVINDEIQRLSKEGLDVPTLEDAKRQLRGQVTLGMESPSSRMYRAASVVLYGRPYKSLDKILDEIQAVDPSEVRAVAQEFFVPERQTSVWLGPN